MKKLLLAASMVLIYSCSYAANWTMLPTQSGFIDGIKGSGRLFLLEFVADADDAGIEPLTLSGFSCYLTGAELKRDATTPPSTVSIDIKSYLGNSYTGFPISAISTSGFIRDADSSPINILGDITLYVTGNATNSGKGTIGLQCF